MIVNMRGFMANVKWKSLGGVEGGGRREAGGARHAEVTAFPGMSDCEAPPHAADGIPAVIARSSTDSNTCSLRHVTRPGWHSRTRPVVFRKRNEHPALNEYT